MQLLKLLYTVFLVSAFGCAENSLEEIQEPKTFLALGDSYTIGESVEEDFRWPNILRDSLVQMGIEMDPPEIIARTGWRTDELSAAAKSADLSTSYSLVSLLIGVNNQYQRKSPESYAPEFRELLKYAISKAENDTNRVIVLSIPDYGYTPFGSRNKEQISKEIDEYNRINREISNSLGVPYYDITEISREGLNDPSLVASDNLHPSGLQYVRWVSKILEDPDLLSRIR